MNLAARAAWTKAGVNPGLRSGLLALAALAIGAVSLASPIVAVLLLALLGAAAMMQRASTRIDILSLAGPVAAALIVGLAVGLAGAIGVLFVWRLFADARWSAEEAAKLASVESRPSEATWQALAHAWATPVFGLTLVAYTAPHMVAGLPLDLPHVPFWVPLVVGVLAGAAVFDWALRRAAEWRLGEVCAAPALHFLAHHVLFLVAFGLGLDVSAGIVAMIAWRLAHAARQPSFTAVP